MDRLSRGQLTGATKGRDLARHVEHIAQNVFLDVECWRAWDKAQIRDRQERWRLAASSRPAQSLDRLFLRIYTLRNQVLPGAANALEDDELTIFDLESCFATGRIIQRQRDRKTRESKYLVQGRGTDESEIVTVAKIGPTGKLIIVTVYTIDQ